MLKVAEAPAGAAPMPRGFEFAIGQCVTHKTQNMPSLVLDRIRASNGLEIYGLRSSMVDDPQRDRMILGRALIGGVPGSECCGVCLLHDAGLCPMLGRDLEPLTP